MNTYTTLRQANAARQSRWDAGNRITLAYRANEMAGEVGEACNIVKKLERERLGLKGSRASLDDLALELADVVITADLVAMSEGIDLDRAVAAKFNLTSEKVGFPERIAWPGVSMPALTAGLQTYASAEDMRAWARAIMQRPPDFIIGDNYLRRWWIVPRNEQQNVYLHEILRSDDDRALHDHPWPNTSVVIEGEYIEHTPHGSFVRQAGAIVSRQATDAHRLEIPEGGRAVSLFFTGPKVRDWGFYCPQGWRPWQEFCSPTDSSKAGIGCGEHAPLTPEQRAD